jgi:hypothetical protein
LTLAGEFDAEATHGFMSEYSTEEEKARLNELSLRAEKLGYAMRRQPGDPARLDLVSRYPSLIEESERFRRAFYSLEELVTFLDDEESTPVTTTYWSLEVVAPLETHHMKTAGAG